MNELLIVTHTRGDRNKSLARTIHSVEKYLPVGAEHLVIKVPNDLQFVDARIEALTFAPYVCFVDDDDYVVNNSLQLALSAAKSTDVGVAFTDEALVDLQDNILDVRYGSRYYDNINKAPWMIHHLSVINTKHVKLSEVDNRPQSVDHTMRCSAIKAAGAIHVPVVGYHWVQHPTSMTHRYRGMKFSIPIGRTGQIPQFSVNM